MNSMSSRSSGKDFPISKEATTVVCRFAFQGRVSRAHFDWDAPPVRTATTVAGGNFPIWSYQTCAP